MTFGWTVTVQRGACDWTDDGPVSGSGEGVGGRVKEGVLGEGGRVLGAPVEEGGLVREDSGEEDECGVGGE